MTKIKCPVCGKANKEEVKYCVHCDAAIKVVDSKYFRNSTSEALTLPHDTDAIQKLQVIEKKNSTSNSNMDDFPDYIKKESVKKDFDFTTSSEREKTETLKNIKENHVVNSVEGHEKNHTFKNQQSFGEHAQSETSSENDSNWSFRFNIASINSSSVFPSSSITTPT